MGWPILFPFPSVPIAVNSCLFKSATLQCYIAAIASI